MKYTIRSESTMRDIMLRVWEKVKDGLPAGPVVITLSRETRTIDQNAKLWPMLTDISKQVVRRVIAL